MIYKSRARHFWRVRTQAGLRQARTTRRLERRTYSVSARDFIRETMP